MFQKCKDLLILIQHNKKSYLFLNGRYIQKFLYVPEGGEKLLELINNVESFTTNEIDEQILTLLQEHHLFLPSNTTEPTALSYKPERYFPKKRLSLWFNLDRLLEQRLLISAIDFCFGLVEDKGLFQLVLIGYEPLMHWSVIKEIIQFASKQKEERNKQIFFEFNINTDLSIDIPVDLDKLLDEHLLTFSVHISSLDEVKAYRIKQLANLGLRVPIHFTITAENIDQVIDTAYYLAQLNRGADLSFPPLLPLTENNHCIADESLLPDPELYTEQLVKIYKAHIVPNWLLHPVSEFIRRLKEGGSGWCCSAAFGDTLAVDTKGDIYLSPRLIGFPQYKIGNVFENNFINESKPVLEKVIDEFCVENIPVCKECAWKYLCGGICPTVTIPIYALADISENAKKYLFSIYCKSKRTLAETILWDLVSTKHEEAESIETNTGKSQKA